MANNFCRYLSNKYRFQSSEISKTLSYRPCCWWKDDNEHKGFNFLDPAEFAKSRDKLNAITDWTPACNTCKVFEEHNIPSPRLRSFKEISADSIDNDAVTIEFSIDMNCNAACLSCGSWNSSTWVKQEIKFGLRNINTIPKRIPPNKWFDLIKLKMDLSKLLDIHFVGGEPLESELPDLVFKHLEDLKVDASKVRVFFTTNGSRYPSDYLISQIPKYREVQFSLSLDGVGDRFHLLRYPLIWDKIEANTKKLLELNYNNVYINVSATLNPISILYADEIETWAINTLSDQYIAKNDPTRLIFRVNRCEGVMDLSKTPGMLRLVVTNKFGPDHIVTKLMNSTTFDGDIKSMIDHFDEWDKRRQLAWRELFPDSVQYFN